MCRRGVFSKKASVDKDANSPNINITLRSILMDHFLVGKKINLQEKGQDPVFLYV